MKIEFFVSIDDTNAFADARAPLQGDTPKAAANRAAWCWLKGMRLVRETRRALGVGRSMTRMADVNVVSTEQGPPGSEAEPSDGPV